MGNALLKCSNRTVDTIGSSDPDLDLSDYRGADNTRTCLTIKTQHDSLTSNAKNVSFDTVEFRFYSIILGDNPSVSTGPPICMGHNYNPNDTINLTVDSYEAYKVENGRKSELAIASYVREEILLEAGYSRFEIRSAAAKAKKDKERIAASSRQRKFEPILIKVDRVRCYIKYIKKGIQESNTK